MVDLNELIKTIISDPKFAGSGNLASRVYRDEPILLTATQMEKYTPTKYRTMRKMARGNGIYHDSETKIFYEQGKFMEDFEDEYDFQGDFVKYFPTYQAMNDSQLRGYFSWRTKVRRGLIEWTPLSFVFVYIYELLNQIGVSSAEQGFQALKGFWTAYKEIEPKIDGYVRTWLNDYVVYYNLDKSRLDEMAEADYDQAVLRLLDYKSYDAEEVFSALNSLSSYNMENSRFYKKHPDDVKNVVYEVFAAFSEHYGQKNKKSLCEKFFGKVCSSPYFMFKSAVFHDRIPHPDYVYEVNDICKYTCKHGLWNCERFFRYRDKNQHIGDMLKTIDFLMRQKFGFKSTLKGGRSTKTLENIINGAMNKLEERRREAARNEIAIDLSRLQNIREAALETQGKLIIDDPAEPDQPSIAAKKSWPANNHGLNDDEYRFMGCLLYGRSYDEFIRSRGLMLSVLVDSINESLFDLFGDTVITEAGGRPELLEDYVDELKEIIKE